MPFWIRSKDDSSFGLGISIPGRGGSSSRSGSNKQDKNGDEEDAYFSFPRASEPDPWVQSAPLILAATCADDSVALVAVHTQPSSSQTTKNPGDNNEENPMDLEEEEPFLYESIWAAKHNQSSIQQRTNVMDSNQVNPTNGTFPASNHTPAIDDDWWRDNSNVQVVDLPRHFAGPTRIGNLGHEMALVATGWRADCDTLTESAQRLVQQEHSLLASPVNGHVVASELSLWMAHRIVVQEQVRYDLMTWWLLLLLYIGCLNDWSMCVHPTSSYHFVLSL